MSGDMSDEKKAMDSPATLPIEDVEESTKLNSGPGSKDNLDEHAVILNRDPNGMNSDVKIRFEDLIGESDPDVYSFDSVWLLSLKVFTCTKRWCYRISTLLLAIPMSVIWGCWFAWLAFLRVWCCMPCIRAFKLETDCCHQLFRICIASFILPCFEAISKIFSNFRIHFARNDTLV